MLNIKWFGHSSFKLNYDGYQIVIDPFDDNVIPGLKGVYDQSHCVYCSHEHKDHNARENVSILPYTDNPFKVTVVDSYHDQSMGSQRGLNKILILENNDLKCIHLGDIGCFPTDDELKLLMNPSVLFVPIGGHYTLNREEIVRLIHMIKPNVIVPMHYRSDGFGPNVIGTLDEFTCLMDLSIKHYGSSYFNYTSDMTNHIAVLLPKNKV